MAHLASTALPSAILACRFTSLLSEAAVRQPTDLIFSSLSALLLGMPAPSLKSPENAVLAGTRRRGNMDANAWKRFGIVCQACAASLCNICLHQHSALDAVERCIWAALQDTPVQTLPAEDTFRRCTGVIMFHRTASKAGLLAAATPQLGSSVWHVMVGQASDLLLDHYKSLGKGRESAAQAEIVHSIFKEEKLLLADHDNNGDDN